VRRLSTRRYGRARCRSSTLLKRIRWDLRNDRVSSNESACGSSAAGSCSANTKIASRRRIGSFAHRRSTVLRPVNVVSEHAIRAPYSTSIGHGSSDVDLNAEFFDPKACQGRSLRPSGQRNASNAANGKRRTGISFIANPNGSLIDQRIPISRCMLEIRHKTASRRQMRLGSSRRFARRCFESANRG